MRSGSRRKQREPTDGISRDKARSDRERRRAPGFRPIRIWGPDTRSPGFAAEARRQCQLIAASSHAAADQAFVDAIFAFE